MDKLKQYQADMGELSDLFRQMGASFLKATAIVQRIADAAGASESDIPPAMEIHNAYASPEAVAHEPHDTEPAPALDDNYGPEDPAAESVPNPDLQNLRLHAAPRPCENHEVGSCSCDGPITGPHFQAPAKPEAKPCRVSIAAGAYTGKTGTVITAKRGQRLRVLVDHKNKPPTEDDVFTRDVILLEGSAPLPVYAPKAKAAT